MSEVRSPNRPFISTRYILISLGLSLTGMGVVIWLTWSPGLLDHLAMKRMPGLVIALLVTILRSWFVAAKIHFLSEGELGWAASWRVSLIWDFGSAVTPSTIGGAPIATYAMNLEGIRLGRSTAIILYGVLLDQFWYALAVPCLLIAGAWLEVVPPETGFVGTATMSLIYFGLLLYGGVLAYGLLVNPRSLKKLLSRLFSWRLLRKHRRRVLEESEHLEEYSREIRKKPLSFLLKAYFLSTMAWLCRIAIPVIVILSLLPADELTLVFRSLAMSLASLIIPTPGGSGGMEGLFALFLGPLVSRTEFIGLAVFLWRFMTFFAGIGVGIMVTTWYVNRSVNGDIRPGGEENNRRPLSDRDESRIPDTDPEQETGEKVEIE